MKFLGGGIIHERLIGIDLLTEFIMHNTVFVAICFHRSEVLKHDFNRGKYA